MSYTLHNQNVQSEDKLTKRTVHVLDTFNSCIYGFTITKNGRQYVKLVRGSKFWKPITDTEYQDLKRPFLLL